MYSQYIKMDTFWINNPYILIQNYYEIFPASCMCREEQMNSITRLLIYLIIIFIFLDFSEDLITYLLILILMIVIFYYVGGTQNNTNSKTDSFINSNSDPNLYNEQNKFTKKTNCSYDNTKGYENNKSCNINETMNSSLAKLDKKTFNKKLSPEHNPEIKGGYIDSDNKYVIGNYYPPTDVIDVINNNIDSNIEKNIKRKKKLNFDKYNEYTNDKCRKPTVDNPYANILYTDYLDAGNIPEPCNTDTDGDDFNEMQNLYNSSLFRNTSDVFERENSQRLFMTQPIQQLPNSQTDFANWLYKTAPTCKENTQNCTYFESPIMTSPRY